MISMAIVAMFFKQGVDFSGFIIAANPWEDISVKVEHLENGEDRLEGGEWLLNWVPHPQAIIYISNRLSEH